MKLNGTVTKSGRHWLAAIPALDALTQGTSKADALRMAEAWIRDMLDRQDLPITTTATLSGFICHCPDSAPVIALMLRRQREAAHLSLADVAARLGVKSRNAYARYEQGRSVPTVPQLDRLLAAIDPTGSLAVSA